MKRRMCSREGDESACKPDSVLGFPRGDHPSAAAVASGLVRSTREHRAGHSFTQIGCPILLTLLPVGFTEPPQSPAVLVVSYTTVSPLPRFLGAVYFLWHCPAGRPGWALPTTVPCGVRTFLDAIPRTAITRPTRPHPGYDTAGEVNQALTETRHTSPVVWFLATNWKRSRTRGVFFAVKIQSTSA